MKKCPKCNETKHTNQFGRDKSRKDGRNIYCKECNREVGNKYYHSLSVGDRGRRRLRERERKEKLLPVWVEIVREKLGDLKCSRCGFDENFHAIDFHHKDPLDKKYDIRVMFGCIPNEEYIFELSKCVLLCANCHAILHRDPELF